VSVLGEGVILENLTEEQRAKIEAFDSGFEEGFERGLREFFEERDKNEGKEKRRGQAYSIYTPLPTLHKKRLSEPQIKVSYIATLRCQVGILRLFSLKIESI
jgi:hypothetical protein